MGIHNLHINRSFPAVHSLSANSFFSNISFKVALHSDLSDHSKSRLRSFIPQSSLSLQLGLFHHFCPDRFNSFNLYSSIQETSSLGTPVHSFSTTHSCFNSSHGHNKSFLHQQLILPCTIRSVCAAHSIRITHSNRTVQSARIIHSI